MRARLARLERQVLDQAKSAESFPPEMTDAERVARTVQILTSEPQNDMERRRQDGLRYLLERVRSRVNRAEPDAKMPRFWLGEP